MARSPRLAAWCSVAGGVIGLAITPFMAAVWAYEPGVVWADLSLLTRVVGPTLESWGALTLGSGRVVAEDGTVLAESFAYEVYGKVFFLVYLLMMPIVYWAHTAHAGATSSRWESWIWRVLWTALTLACVGDAVSYWGISVPGDAGQTLWGLGFAVEIVAVLGLLAATTLYGVIALRQGVLPRASSALLVGVVPIAVLTLIGVTPYVPNAVVVPMSLIWASVGVWLLFGGRSSRPGGGRTPVAVNPS